MVKIALIEDNPLTVTVVTAVLAREKQFKVKVYSCPSEYLANAKVYDLVICDWSFGHVDLDFFIDSMDRSKLVVLTGSVKKIDVECLGVLCKLRDTRNLVQIVHSYLKQIGRLSA